MILVLSCHLWVLEPLSHVRFYSFIYLFLLFLEQVLPTTCVQILSLYSNGHPLSNSFLCVSVHLVESCKDVHKSPVGRVQLGCVLASVLRGARLFFFAGSSSPRLRREQLLYKLSYIFIFFVEWKCLPQPVLFNQMQLFVRKGYCWGGVSNCSLKWTEVLRKMHCYFLVLEWDCVLLMLLQYAAGSQWHRHGLEWWDHVK